MSSATEASRAVRRSMAMEPSSAPHLAPGTMIAGRYRILDVLGEGGMGTVYRAEQPALHRRVALKVVRSELSADASMVARFEREAYASSRISSPHVVVVHDFGRDESGILYLVMEMLEGESLATRLEREGALPLPVALAICRDVARALETAHAAGIVHRDLKPDNVFLGTHGDVKVLDFGIARIVEGPGGPAQGNNTTMTGMIVGTPVYMSPEAISRGVVGPAADLYALGVMFFEMLSGQPPFMADEAVVLMSHHLTAPPPRLETLVPSLAKKPEIPRLVSRLLAKQAADRGETTATLLELLALAKRYGDASQGGLATTVVTSLPRSVAPPSERSTLVVGLAALVVAAAGVGLGLWAYDRASHPAPTTSATTTVEAPATTPVAVEPPPPPPTTIDEAPTTETVAPSTVVITLEGLPEGATLEAPGATIDGAALTYPVDDATHSVVVRAEGFEPLTLEVGARDDATLTPELVRRRRSGERRTGLEPTSTSEPAGTTERGGLRREF